MPGADTAPARFDKTSIPETAIGSVAAAMSRAVIRLHRSHRLPWNASLPTMESGGPLLDSR